MDILASGVIASFPDPVSATTWWEVIFVFLSALLSWKRANFQRFLLDFSFDSPAFPVSSFCDCMDSSTGIGLTFHGVYLMVRWAFGRFRPS